MNPKNPPSHYRYRAAEGFRYARYNDELDFRPNRWLANGRRALPNQLTGKQVEWAPMKEMSGFGSFIQVRYFAPQLFAFEETPDGGFLLHVIVPDYGHLIYYLVDGNAAYLAWNYFQQFTLARRATALEESELCMRIIVPPVFTIRQVNKIDFAP